MLIALASPRCAVSVDDALQKIKESMKTAMEQGAEIVCFPEAYLPGLRGLDFEVPDFDEWHQQRALELVARWAREYRVAVVLGMERLTDAGRQIVSAVFDATGALLGYQTKNQLDPTEEPLYVPGDTRQVFEINGVKFGVAICHEGFRYPETVRWAARRGAKLVFHPHCTGSDRDGIRLTQFASSEAPYYEKAMMCRALENGIYFASVNYGFRYPESATSVIGPGGECLTHLPYGQDGVLVQRIDPALATGLLASRYAPDRYRELDSESATT
jgi:predicted amidohydrolase